MSVGQEKLSDSYLNNRLLHTHHIVNILQYFLWFSTTQLPSTPPAPKNVPILYFLPFRPYMHVFIVFFCHCNRATARCSQDGIIRENVCAAYFSQGLSLANYCLDGSQRFSPITCIFHVSRVDAGQGPARAVGAALSGNDITDGQRSGTY